MGLLHKVALGVLALAPSALFSACACEKNVSIDAWCKDQTDRCEGLRSLDTALEKLALQCQSAPSEILLSSCGKTTKVSDGDGFLGRSLSYDSKGKLVGGSYYSDVSVDECDSPSGGKSQKYEDSCSICRFCTVSGVLTDEACDPKLGSALVDSCLGAAPASFEGECRSCACNACYPLHVAAIPEQDAGYQAESTVRDFTDCALERCTSCDRDTVLARP